MVLLFRNSFHLEQRFYRNGRQANPLVQHQRVCQLIRCKASTANSLQ
jgi:hypothetical protein